eukprot:5016660-Amphidinium_carterae.3
MCEADNHETRKVCKFGGAMKVCTIIHCQARSLGPVLGDWHHDQAQSSNNEQCQEEVTVKEGNFHAPHAPTAHSTQRARVQPSLRKKLNNESNRQCATITYGQAS